MPAKKKAAAKQAPAKEPILTCPFTGKEIELVYSESNGCHMARGPFWNTRLYKTRAELYYDISHRMGVAPAFSKEMPKITVKSREEPDPNPNADLVVTDVIGDRIDEL